MLLTRPIQPFPLYLQDLSKCLKSFKTCRSDCTDESHQECNSLLLEKHTADPVHVLGLGEGPVWQPTQSFEYQRHDPGEEDLLPPFHMLTNDDDREKKAMFRHPGTFNVVVNPASFVDFDEYHQTFPQDPFPPAISSYGGPPANRVSCRPITRPDSPLNSWDASTSSFSLSESQDQDVIVLKIFEDSENSLTSPPSTLAKGISRSRSHTYSNTSASITGSVGAQRGDIFNFSIDNTPLMKYAHPDGRDHSIIYYYKNFVHRHLAQVHRDTLGTSLETGALTAPDVFERQAGSFLPVSMLLHFVHFLGVLFALPPLVKIFLSQKDVFSILSKRTCFQVLGIYPVVSHSFLCHVSIPKIAQKSIFFTQHLSHSI